MRSKTRTTRGAAPSGERLAPAGGPAAVPVRHGQPRGAADPEAFGVSDAVNPCFDRVSSLCTPEQSLERAFFDPLHPNLVLHEDIAEIAGAEMQPVPLPAPALLLVAAVAMMAAVGVRRRA